MVLEDQEVLVAQVEQEDQGDLEVLKDLEGLADQTDLEHLVDQAVQMDREVLGDLGGLTAQLSLEDQERLVAH